VRLQHPGPDKHSICVSACVPACLSACLSICLPACLSACLSICLPICLTECLPACLPVYLPARPPVCLPACLPACLCTCPLHPLQWNATRGTNHIWLFAHDEGACWAPTEIARASLILTQWGRLGQPAMLAGQSSKYGPVLDSWTSK
jgi:hypothetical protein